MSTKLVVEVTGVDLYLAQDRVGFGNDAWERLDREQKKAILDNLVWLKSFEKKEWIQKPLEEFDLLPSKLKEGFQLLEKYAMQSLTYPALHASQRQLGRWNGKSTHFWIDRLRELEEAGWLEILRKDFERDTPIYRLHTVFPAYEIVYKKKED